MQWLGGAARAVGILLLAALVVFGSAHAANTIVTAIVCSPATGSVITITSPVTDSTVNDPVVVLAGHITQAQSVDISVDGVVRTSLALTTLDQDFSTRLILTQGTHDISLATHDVCHVSDGSASTVVTYVPGAVPSQGSHVPTQVPVQPPAPVTGKPVTEPISGPGLIKQAPGIGTIPRTVVDAAQPARSAFNTTPLVVAVPFVVGAGAFGWIHIRRIMH